MIQIRKEIELIESGQLDIKDNMLKNAPHTIQEVSATQWTHPYTREDAVYPVDSLRHQKFWPSAARVNNAFGDRNLVCSCQAMVLTA